MATSLSPLFLVGICLLLIGCDRAHQTVVELDREISQYSTASTAETTKKIQDGFAKLDADIQALETQGKLADARDLRDERNSLQARFLSARVAVGLTKVRSSVQDFGDAVKQVGDEIGQSLQAPGQNATSEEVSSSDQ